MRLASAVMVAAFTTVGACSGDTQHPAATTPATAAPPPASAQQPPAANASTGAVTAETFCFKLAQLTDKCPALAAARLDPASCVEQAREPFKSLDQHAGLAGFVHCVVTEDDCDGFTQCVSSGELGDHIGDPANLRACNDHSERATLTAAGIPKAEWDQRRGAHVTTFRGAQSTMDAPIEMCGVDAANRWLATLTCEDGSRPIHGNAEAETTRAGNVGHGGRCGSIIDHYVAPCPGKYDIYIDAYVCPK